MNRNYWYVKEQERVREGRGGGGGGERLPEIEDRRRHTGQQGEVLQIFVGVTLHQKQVATTPVPTLPISSAGN